MSILAGSTPGKGSWIHWQNPDAGLGRDWGSRWRRLQLCSCPAPPTPWPGFSISLQGMEVFCSRVLHSVILAEFRAVGSVHGQSCDRFGREGAVVAAGGGSLPGSSRGFVRRSFVCAWCLVCPGVEGSAGAPKPSAQLSQDRTVLLEEQLWFVHTVLKCICAHLVCWCLKDLCLNRITLRDSGKGECGSLAHSFVFWYLI